MQNRSSSKFVGKPSTNPTSMNPKRHNCRRSKQRVELFALEETPIVTIANQRTMADLLCAPTEGYAKAIVVPHIPAEHSELKHSLINLVTSKQFFSFEKEDPHAHIRYFNKITSTLKYKDVPETSIKLMLFPFSIDGPAQIWLDKEPSRSILTWDDLVSKFINHFFPPSKTTNLRNEISNFQQRFDETFYEAWYRFKDILRACPHHGFTELHQLDTFYNGLNPSDQDSLNSAAGGNLLERKIASAVASAVTSAMTAIFKQHQVTPAPAFVKAVEESCVTCGGAHLYRQCPATDGNTFSGYQDNIQGYVLAAAVNYNQGNTGYRPQSIALLNRMNEMRNEMQATMSNQTNELKNMMASFFQMNTASSSGTGSLPSNTVANPRGDLKVITTQSGISYDGPPIPPPLSPLPKVVEREPKGMVECSALADLDITLRFNDEAITFKVGQTSRYSYNNSESVNRIDVIDVSCEEYTQEVLGFSNSSKSGNPTPSLNPILSTSFPSLTPFEGGDFILEEIQVCLTNDSIPPRIDDAEFDPEGDLLLLEKLLNDDKSSPLPPKELHLEELKTIKSSIDDPPELELKDLPSHLEYAFLEGTDKLPVIISKELKDEEKAALLKVLKSHKRAIACKISDIKGLDTSFCTHKILMEDDFKPAVQHQRRTCERRSFVVPKKVVDIVENEDNEWILQASYRMCMMAVSTDLIGGNNGGLYGRFLGLQGFFLVMPLPFRQNAQTSGIEVDKAKVDIIAKLPHPTTVKGVQRAENLAADHLSRLENPHQSDLENKEITETFSFETLGMVTFRGDSRDCPDFEGSRAHGFVHRPLDFNP
ncbi:reverse transcriptase domain-containing protein [Tanacetum coccineum]|uniref:Reverse transcriptase domain-containing protein n=1 Tax=Tanacetum coccineum TaxID=301880 RepID=A0ABQ4XMX8_9ASTR